jgi:serine/threonine protein kinase
MELCIDGNLSKYKKNLLKNEDQIANVMLGIARGVKYMHKFHIRHGDLKLENIIICHVKIYLF